LTSIGGDLLIINNPFLTSLAGLDKINPGTIANLIICGNSTLSTCEAKGVCEVLAGAARSAYIHFNAPGCNSVEEVKAKCGTTGTETLFLSDAFKIFPNPSSGRFTIDLAIISPSHVEMVILNSLGQLVATILDEPLTQGSHQFAWDGEGLPEGVYYCRLRAGKNFGMIKVALLK
jgi:hypothetical protein